ncbi:MAG: glycosyltransferase, partial [Bacteroidetes bacterium]
MILSIFIIAIIYSVLIGSFIIGFDCVEEFNIESTTATSSFSIIIPFRNEAGNLSELLQSLSNLHYPKHLFEIL